MLLKISKFFLYTSLLSVVIVLTSTFFPFIGGKYYFFRIAIESSLIFLLLHWAFEAPRGFLEKRFREIISQPLFIAVSVFVLMYLLASVFAYDPHGAFWSNYERGEGGFQMLHYYAFFALLLLLFTSEKDWRRAFWVFIAAAVVMVLYGVMGYVQAYQRATHVGDSQYAPILCQKFKASTNGELQERCLINFITPYQGGSIPDNFWSIITSARFQGSLGNPAYVAPYLMFAIFFALYLFFSHKGSAKRLVGFVSIGISALFFFFFAITQTRGAFIGLAIGALSLLTYLGYWSRKHRMWFTAAIGALLLFGATLVHFRNSDFVKNMPGSRFFDLNFSTKALVAMAIGAFIVCFLVVLSSEKKYRKWAVASLLLLAVLVPASFKIFPVFGVTEQSASTRFWTWQSAWHGFKDRPILGWGPENFSTVFDRHFDPRHFTPGTNSETWFDRAHSVIFDYLAETGILGFLSYLAIFLVFFWQFFKRHSEGNNGDLHNITWERGLLLAVVIGYLVQGLALFDVLPIYLPLFLTLAFSAHKFWKVAAEKKIG